MHEIDVVILTPIWHLPINSLSVIIFLFRGILLHIDPLSHQLLANPFSSRNSLRIAVSVNTSFSSSFDCKFLLGLIYASSPIKRCCGRQSCGENPAVGEDA